MSKNTCWIPQLELRDSSESWLVYENRLYEIFRKDFIESHPKFEGKIVQIRRHPIVNDKEEAFYHVICQDYLKDGNRVPDFRRCERIRWIKSFIENYNCNPKLCNGCEGVKVWVKPYKTNQRICLFLEEERYIVVLEKREKYCLLITAFYIEHEHSLEKKRKEFLQWK